ncbi:MAG TPA: F0F1 ATP synthase subunit B [Gemmatimonadetes bacterium]|jgi:F-type H+-transporting ATPase subunit b|nr:F0F1 ATP synthase subunit B [Gemmatimonadota bacterium]HIC16269.1 F0F1 ATP synthase subunit B [Gemmatimonadota bacterium]
MEITMRVNRLLTGALAFLVASPNLLFAQGEGEGGGGLYDINTGLSVWTLIVFVSLLFVLGKYAWGPIVDAVDGREKGIQAALDEAADLNAEAARLLDEHREQIADARRQASEIFAEAKVAGDRVRKELEEKARAEAQGIVERALAEIERERDGAIETLRRESVDLVLAAASRLMRESFDQDTDRELVERYLDELVNEGAQA